MSSYIIAGSADSIDTAYVLLFTLSAKKSRGESAANTKISILELSSSILQNGNSTFKKYAESTGSSRSQIRLSIRLTGR